MKFCNTHTCPTVIARVTSEHYRISIAMMLLHRTDNKQLAGKMRPRKQVSTISYAAFDTVDMIDSRGLWVPRYV